MEEMQGAGNVPLENPELWIQLSEETRSTNFAILETVQELKNEMARLREDNARLTVEQERILKSLLDRQNPPLSNPSAEQQKNETIKLDLKIQKVRRTILIMYQNNKLQNVRGWNCRESFEKLNPHILMGNRKKQLKHG